MKFYLAGEIGENGKERENEKYAHKLKINMQYIYTLWLQHLLSSINVKFFVDIFLGTQQCHFIIIIIIIATDTVIAATHYLQIILLWIFTWKIYFVDNFIK